MMTTTKTEQLLARDAEAVEAQRGAIVRAYLAVLDNRVTALLGRPVGILAALEEERRNIVACAAEIRRALLAVLEQYPAPPPEARKIIANQIHAIRSQAQGALNTLDNPALLDQWIQKIANPPDTVSPNLAEAHWLHIWPLLGRAKGLPSVPADLAAAAQALEALAARLLASGVPAVELPGGRGPLATSLETPPASRSYKARTEVDHE